MTDIPSLASRLYQGQLTPDTGEFAPGATAAQFPASPGKMVRMKARAANTGVVCIGSSSTVTLADGTTDTTTGFQLSAGEDTGWMPVSNLSLFWGIGAGASDSVTYLVLA